jgi:hypothetical protein
MTIMLDWMQCNHESPRYSLMVTLAGLEPATSPAPSENKDALSPLSYSVVTIFVSVCGGAGADGKGSTDHAHTSFAAALIR